MGLCDEEKGCDNFGWQHGKVFRDFVDFGLKQNGYCSTNKHTCILPRAVQVHVLQTELQIHAVGCALIHHIMNIEINTKWLNNSSGDRAG